MRPVANVEGNAEEVGGGRPATRVTGPQLSAQFSESLGQLPSAGLQLFERLEPVALGALLPELGNPPAGLGEYCLDRIVFALDLVVWRFADGGHLRPGRLDEPRRPRRWANAPPRSQRQR